MMRRRDVISLLGGAAVANSLAAWPLAARAQQAGKVRNVAWLGVGQADQPSPYLESLRAGLRELGYVEGQNIVIEWRWGHGKTERFPEFAAEVVRIPVDVIVAANTPAGVAAKKATQTIPIVIATMVDPVGDGFVATIARPGGNITGLTLQTPEITAKRLELLKEAVPKVTRVAFLADRNAGGYKETKQAAAAAARSLGMQLQVHEVGVPGDLNDAFASMRR
jgi:ABC-type uncharacterized transport system, periplasmic component